jgi:hypothetical protein
MIKMPNSKTGKWSVGFGIAFVVLMALSLLVAFVIGGDPTVIEGSTVVSILVLILNAALNFSGLLSLVLGIYTIVKYKEWSVGKYLAVLYGLALLLFVLGEFLFPH